MTMRTAKNRKITSNIIVLNFERSIEMRANISKWNALAATLLYASAVFQIADNHFGLGAIFFVAASSFAVAARINKKTDPENEKQ